MRPTELMQQSPIRLHSIIFAAYTALEDVSAFHAQKGNTP